MKKLLKIKKRRVGNDEGKEQLKQAIVACRKLREYIKKAQKCSG